MPDTGAPSAATDTPVEIEEIREWMAGGKRPSFASDDTLSDASVAYLSVDRLLRELGK